MITKQVESSMMMNIGYGIGGGSSLGLSGRSTFFVLTDLLNSSLRTMFLRHIVHRRAIPNALAPRDLPPNHQPPPFFDSASTSSWIMTPGNSRPIHIFPL